VLSSCGKPDYQKQLAKELAVIGNSEMWQAGKAVRALRPKEAARAIAAGTKGIGGRAANEGGSGSRPWPGHFAPATHQRRG
jgi:hypothetical protein